ncbi:DoxX family protein [Salisaeta longa]|uniref:DoxX family protein n=1 Tax=Salisaeta longa TaxID=503170 RepID=UPI0003B788E3|nr:DoxX family protein [Salisaeta longa]
MIGSNWSGDKDLGLLVLRVGAGLYLALGHGLGKITGGTEAWAQVGGATALIGLDFAPAFWGFLAAIAEFAGSLLVVIGLAARPASLLVVLTMGMAMLMHLMTGNGSPEMAVLYLLAFAVVLIAGPGKYSVDAKL